MAINKGTVAQIEAVVAAGADLNKEALEFDDAKEVRTKND